MDKPASIKRPALLGRDSIQGAPAISNRTLQRISTFSWTGSTYEYSSSKTTSPLNSEPEFLSLLPANGRSRLKKRHFLLLAGAP